MKYHSLLLKTRFFVPIWTASCHLLNIYQNEKCFECKLYRKIKYFTCKTYFRITYSEVI